MRGQELSAAALPTARWQALGTTIVMQVRDREAVGRARVIVERELDAIDLACSRFRPDSELAMLNAASGRSTTVGPLLLEALEQSLRAAELTGGDVDPTIGRALVLAGYDRDFQLLAPPGEGAAAQLDLAAVVTVTARVRAGWREVSIDRDSSAVRTPAGVLLDVGAIAKAWAADRAAAAAAQDCGCGVLVSIGGDIATSGPPPDGGWQVRVTDDHRSDSSAPGQTVSILSGGLATSSTSVRRWSQAGRTMHHIIDPDTGAPARGTWRTVSVTAGTCTDANIASTAAMIRSDAAPAWLGELGLPSRLVGVRGEVTVVAGWPEPAEQTRTASAA